MVSLSLSLGLLQVVLVLLSHGAHVNPQDLQGNTPLHFTCTNGHHEAAMFLLFVSVYEHLPACLSVCVCVTQAVPPSSTELMSLWLTTEETPLFITQPVGTTPHWSTSSCCMGHNTRPVIMKEKYPWT